MKYAAIIFILIILLGCSTQIEQSKDVSQDQGSQAGSLDPEVQEEIDNTVIEDQEIDIGEMY